MRVTGTLNIGPNRQNGLLFLLSKPWQLQNMHAGPQMDAAQPSHPKGWRALHGLQMADHLRHTAQQYIKPQNSEYKVGNTVQHFMSWPNASTSASQLRLLAIVHSDLYQAFQENLICRLYPASPASQWAAALYKGHSTIQATCLS